MTAGAWLTANWSLQDLERMLPYNIRTVFELMYMMMKKNIGKTVLTILLVLSAQAVSAQKEQFNPVYTGVTSLSIAPDARAGAMGDVGCATDPYNDNNSQYWNPSKYPFANSQAGLSLCYTPWLRQLVSDIDLANLVGYYKLDDLTSGWQASDLVIIAGRPAMGKTSFALSMAKNIAADSRVEQVILPLRDGLTLIRKRQ